MSPHIHSQILKVVYFTYSFCDNRKLTCRTPKCWLSHLKSKGAATCKEIIRLNLFLKSFHLYDWVSFLSFLNYFNSSISHCLLLETIVRVQRASNAFYQIKQRKQNESLLLTLFLKEIEERHWFKEWSNWCFEFWSYIYKTEVQENRELIRTDPVWQGTTELLKSHVK